MRRTARTEVTIRELPLFRSCSRREVRDVARLGTRLGVPAGRRLLVQGARGSELIVLVEGYASCRIGGREVIVFGPGDFVGEIGALTGAPRTATVAALTPMDVLVFDEPEVHVLTRTPSVAATMAREMAGRIRLANDAALA